MTMLHVITELAKSPFIDGCAALVTATLYYLGKVES